MTMLRTTIALSLVAASFAANGDSKGHQAVEFPSPSKAWLKEGAIANPSALRQVEPGMSKDQLYILIGRPHFKEGMFSVREWDYLFHFRTDTPGRMITCQYKVMFDKQYRTSQMYWSPAACANLVDDKKAVAIAAQQANQLQQAQPLPPQQATTRRYTLSGDMLFPFGKYQIDSLSDEARRALDEIVAKLRGAQIQNIAISGHADRIGSPGVNMRLSQNRADSVRGYFIQSGLRNASIQSTGYGANRPIKDCELKERQALAACLADNRRVEVEATFIAN